MSKNKYKKLKINKKIENKSNKKFKNYTYFLFFILKNHILVSKYNFYSIYISLIKKK